MRHFPRPNNVHHSARRNAGTPHASAFGVASFQNCAIAFKGNLNFQHKIPRHAIFYSGVCEINAQTKVQGRPRQHPRRPYLNVGASRRAARPRRKWAFISHAQRPPSKPATTTLKCGALGCPCAQQTHGWAFISHSPDRRTRGLGVIQHIDGHVCISHTLAAHDLSVV